MMLPTDAAMTTRRSSLSGPLAALIGLPSCRAYCVHQAWMFVRFRPAARRGLNCGTTYRIFVLYGSIPRRPGQLRKDPAGRLTRRVTRPAPPGLRGQRRCLRATPLLTPASATAAATAGTTPAADTHGGMYSAPRPLFATIEATARAAATC